MKSTLTFALLSAFVFSASTQAALASNIILTNMAISGIFQAAGSKVLSSGGPLSADPTKARVISVAPFAHQILEIMFSDAIVGAFPDLGTIPGMDIYPYGVDGGLTWTDPTTGLPVEQYFSAPEDMNCCSFAAFFDPPSLSTPVLFTLTANMAASYYSARADENVTGYFVLSDAPEPGSVWLFCVGCVGLKLKFRGVAALRSKHLHYLLMPAHKQVADNPLVPGDFVLADPVSQNVIDELLRLAM